MSLPPISAPQPASFRRRLCEIGSVSPKPFFSVSPVFLRNSVSKWAAPNPGHICANLASLLQLYLSRCFSAPPPPVSPIPPESPMPMTPLQSRLPNCLIPRRLCEIGFVPQFWFSPRSAPCPSALASKERLQPWTRQLASFPPTLLFAMCQPSPHPGTNPEETSYNSIEGTQLI